MSADDWASKLAAEILTETQRYGALPGFADMLAMRLRVVKAEGEEEAISKIVKAVEADE